MSANAAAWDLDIITSTPSSSREGGVRRSHYERDQTAVTEPGVLLTAKFFADEKKFRTAFELIDDFHRVGYSWNSEDFITIPAQTAKAAKLLLRKLGAQVPLPQFAPDGDGSLVMIWNHKDDPVVAVVDGWKLHVARAATTPRATYFNNLVFNAEIVPSELSKAIF